MPTRRTTLQLSLSSLMLAAAPWTRHPAFAQAAAPAPRLHALAKVGEPAFPATFKNFNWVNPAAPKGGSLTLGAQGSFDNLNPYTFKGSLAPGVTLLDATLLSPSLDEPATAYGLIAEWVSHPEDLTSVTFGLRASARFHDGRTITPEDVVFSFEEQKRASPSIAIYYRDVEKAEKTGDREVTFHFAKGGNRDLPYIIGLLAVLPKHYWTAKAASGSPRNLAETTLEPLLGSGPYKIKAVDAGRSIVLERVKDWWGRDLPVNVGQYNFDVIRYLMYRDDVPAFEALKSGEVDLTEENSSKRWATGYDIPAVREGRLRKIVLSRKAVAALQGFVLNTRRPRFADPRIRQAFALAYDFESANKSLFYGLYRRLNSYFDNSDLASRGLPSGRELEILEKLKDKVPPQVFTAEYKSPVSATPEEARKNLREAARLFQEAGWKLDGGVLKNAKTGEPMSVEFLNYDTQFDRIVLPYKQNLERLGVQFQLRIVDPTQYEQRLKTFDFDMITDALQPSQAPGNELRELFGSAAADTVASRNRAGIKNPAVDAIIEEAIYARTREDLIAATRALDRVLLWNHYMVLQWFNPDAWIAYWDKFGRPDPHPSQDPGVVTTWWIDAALSAKLEGSDAKK